MFVTMLNLLPMGQLDGGHILYARLPRWHQRVALAFWLLVVALGTLWVGWFIWGGLVLVLSRGRLGRGRSVEVGGGWGRLGEVVPRRTTSPNLHQPPPTSRTSGAAAAVLRNRLRRLSLPKPALGSACPDNRHATTHPIRTKRSSTTFPPSDSTDNSSPFASRYAGRKTGSGAGACCSALRTPRPSAPRRRSSAPRRSRTCGRRCATCEIIICAISTARCCRWPTRWTPSGSSGTTCRTPWPRSWPRRSCSCSARTSTTRKRSPA